MFRWNLRNRLLVIPMITLLTAFLFIGLMLKSRIGNVFESNENTNLSSMSAMIVSDYNDRVSKIGDILKMALSDRRLYESFIGAQRGASGDLREILVDVGSLAGVDGAIALRRDGKVVLNTGGAVGEAILSDIDISRPREITTKVVRDGDNLRLVAAGPVQGGGNIAGTVLFVRTLNTDFLAGEKAHFGGSIDVSAIADGRIFASTLKSPNFPADKNEEIFDYEIGGRPYRHRFVQIDRSGVFLALSYDLSRAKSDMLYLRNLLSTIFAVVLALIAGIIIVNVRRVSKGIDVLVEQAERISKGSFSHKVELRNVDEVSRLADAMNTMSDRIKAIINDINGLTKAAVEGRLDTRADCARQSGDFCDIVSGVNNTLDAVIMPLSMAAEYVHQISKGVIPPRVVGEFHGDFNDIKKNLNVLIDEMEAVTRLAGEIAGGNLTVEIKERSAQDVLMQQLALMVGRLKEVVMLVQKTSTEVVSGSEQLSQNSDGLARGASEQSIQAEQAAAAMTEISHVVIDMAKSALEASVAAGETSKLASEGLDIVQNTVLGMQSVDDAVMETASTIEELGRSSREIGEIIDTINAIADQTNLLALNAAIEAARAGESGRGFAVVADEVRKLAERTARATHNISVMIKKIQGDTEKAVAGMEAAKVEMEKGVRLSENARQSLNHIVEASGRGTEMIQQIATSTEEQSTALTQVSSSMELIANVTRSIKESGSDIQVAAQHLKGMALSLQDAIGWFKIDSSR